MRLRIKHRAPPEPHEIAQRFDRRIALGVCEVLGHLPEGQLRGLHLVGRCQNCGMGIHITDADSHLRGES